MTTNLHLNATPNTVFTGTKDTKGKGTSRPIVNFANFTLLNPIMASWGSLETPLAISNGLEATKHFGDNVFDENSPFYNYQTPLSELQIKAGTPTFMWRMGLPNMKKANGRLFIEIVEDSIPQFERRTNGAFEIDTVGGLKPILIEGTDTQLTLPGFKYRYLFEKALGNIQVGAAEVVDGTLTGMVNEVATVSKIYPVADLTALHMGSYGNRLNISLSSPKVTSTPVVKLENVEYTENAFYRLMLSVSNVNGGTTLPHYTENSAEHVDFVLEEYTSTESGTPVDFDTVYQMGYSDTEALTSGAKHDAPVEFHFYKENIKSVLRILHTAEVTQKTQLMSYPLIAEENIYSFNLLDGKDFNGIPYLAVREASSNDTPNNNTVILNTHTKLRLAGGNDGSVSNSSFNDAVRNSFDAIEHKFPVADMLQFPFHWVMDMGLDQDTTESLYKILVHRNDVAVIGATFESEKALKTTAEIISSAMGIAAAAALFPESTIYSTPASRGALVPYGIKLKNMKWRRPISSNYELAEKLQAYLGRTDLVWVIQEDPMTAKNKNFKHTLLNFKSEQFNLRSDMWSNQLVAIGSTGHEIKGFVGLQSINPHDNSVLNSLLVIAALLQATWAAEEAIVRERGRTASPAVIAENIDKHIKLRCKDIDSSKATIVPSTYQTVADVENTFSLTTDLFLEGGNQITANTVTVHSSFASLAN